MPVSSDTQTSKSRLKKKAQESFFLGPFEAPVHRTETILFEVLDIHFGPNNQIVLKKFKGTARKNQLFKERLKQPRSFLFALIHLLDRWFVGWLVGWLVRSFIHSFIHSFTHSSPKTRLNKRTCFSKIDMNFSLVLSSSVTNTKKPNKWSDKRIPGYLGNS